jgi:hypothetical protein
VRSKSIENGALTHRRCIAQIYQMEEFLFTEVRSDDKQNETASENQ